MMSVCGGIDWEAAAVPLFEVHWTIALLFVCYIIFVTLVVMNVMTGIFCESAIGAAAQDREQVITNQIKDRDRFVKMLTDIFNQWDIDGTCDGDITLQDFEDHLEDKNVQAIFQSLEIGTDDAWDFFKLLDEDGEGIVDLEHFIEGCIRLRGAAKAFHIANLEYEFRWMMSQVSEIHFHMQRLDSHVQILKARASQSERHSAAVRDKRSLRELAQAEVEEVYQEDV